MSNVLLAKQTCQWSKRKSLNVDGSLRRRREALDTDGAESFDRLTIGQNSIGHNHGLVDNAEIS